MGGIIPACAGFTVEQLEPSKVDAGSSPLARGLPVSLTWDATRQGIIPACAGFTGTLSGTDSGTPDHPRLRGVYAQGLGKVGGGGLMSGVVGVLARVRRGPAGTMGGA